ncbi:hypothetical protein G7061_02120 [Erysipelothrix sp. HDW6B]|uniref:hypothetical protein n=1 Tax=Erysipelothrix TaxID=1647 RepID=UPI0013588744|nr:MULTISPECIES: hypothetical protein [Erysipelothrix]QIK85486.1 hypothetical protein G7061_02120 [Erysipelothrix sp. HDW6B]
MKISIEFYVLMVFFGLGVLVTLDFCNLIIGIQQVHTLRDVIVHEIEVHDRYDSVVKERIQSKNSCQNCTYFVKNEDRKFKVLIQYVHNFSYIPQTVEISAYGYAYNSQEAQ